MLEKNLDVFNFILDKMKEQNILLILSGSTSLALQGVDVEVHDIDIVTDKDGAFKLDELLKKYKIKNMEYSCTRKYKSYFGQYKIDGIKIDIMGEFCYRLANGKWSIENHKHPIYYVDYQEISIPVLSLSQELVEYENTKKYETVKKIKAKLNM